jgi:hypothetical protein
MGRLYGAALIGIVMLTWYARDANESKARRALILDMFVYDAIGLIVAINAIITGVLNLMGWGIVVVYLFFTVGYGYFWYVKKLQDIVPFETNAPMSRLGAFVSLCDWALLLPVLPTQGLPYKGSRAPLTIWASSEQRYRIAWAISSGVVQKAFLGEGSLSRECSTSMLLTRRILAVTPVPLSSCANDSIKASWAAFPMA